MKTIKIKKTSYVITLIVVSLFFQGFMNDIRSEFFTNWGDQLYISKDYKSALEKYKSASKLNSGYAYYRLHYLYNNGEGIEKNPKLAKKMLEKSAELDYPEAQAKLGIQLVGMRKNLPKAISLLKKASLQKNILAYIQLSSIYFYGIGVEKNIQKAQEYIDLANENGASLSLPKQ